jgi:hypothetical protein
VTVGVTLGAGVDSIMTLLLGVIFLLEKLIYVKNSQK